MENSNKPSITPTDGRCLVKPIELQAGKLVFPDENEQGIGVCLIGEYEGKTVYFKKYAENLIKEDGVEYYVVDDEDIIATKN